MEVMTFAAIVCAVVGCVVRAGAALACAVGFLLFCAALYLGWSTYDFGIALFAFSVLVFAVAGGLRRG